MSTVETQDLEGIENHRPLQTLPVHPKATAVRSLFQRLADFGVDEDSAWAVARSVVDPAAARHQLASPSRQRVLGGELLSLYVDVYTPAISAYPVNRREAAHHPYPIAERPQDFAPLLEMKSYDEEGSGFAPAELGMEVETADHLLWSLNRSESWLRGNNRDIGPKVKADGVLQPLTLVLLRVEHQDGEQDRVLLTSADGSSRTAWCHHFLGLTPEAVVYELPDDERAYRTLLGRVRAIQEAPHEGLSTKERAEHRALIAPARIIIGWDADPDAEPETRASFREAIDSLVGLIHVDPPRPWDKGGQVDLYADAALRELLAEEIIDRDEYAWFAGLLSPSDAADAFTDAPDVRLLHLVAVLLNEEYKAVISRGVRKVSSRPQLGPTDRFDIVAELALRSVRHRFDPPELRGVRSALSRGLRWQPFRHNLEWEGLDYEPDLPALRSQALRQVRRGEPGSETVQLVVLGLYWLTVEQYLARERQTSVDYRTPGQVLEAMMVPRGVQLLYRVVRDGRRGKHPVLVDETGQEATDAESGSSSLTDDVIRRAFPGGPKGRRGGRKKAVGRQRYKEIQVQIQQSIADIGTLLSELVNLRDDAGRSLIRTERFPAEFARKVKEGLESARDAIVRLDGRYGEMPDELLGLALDDHEEDVELEDE